ncbi:MAG: S-layer homology domain-containing protein [Clostridia bacterium]|nr:S-layer homology domain-containing protein [Clostridia bacterium]
MKKIISLLLIAICICSCFAIVSQASVLPAGKVLSVDVDLIKTGLSGQSIRFTDTDFKKALGITDFKSLTVVTLPASTEGTLMLGERRVAEGQTISRRNIAALVFTPQSKEVSESTFTFSIDGGSGETFAARLKFIERVNYAPKIAVDTSSGMNLVTQSGISVWGLLEGEDPEDDDIDYIIVSYPKGEISLSDDGEFRYTPTNGFTGKDSFVYVVRDEWGNYSSPATVTVNTVARMSEVVFVDMLDSKSYNAAVAMNALGIMSGSRLGDDMYFDPNGTVSRAEFVAMAMKALSMRADSSLTKTFFDDNSEIPLSLVSYVATAAKRGIVNGSFEDGELLFRPNDPITKCEAAIIMSNLTELKSDSAVFNEIRGITEVPVWARSKVGAMYEAGIFTDDEDSSLNDPLSREAVSEYLYRLMK